MVHCQRAQIARLTAALAEATALAGEATRIVEGLADALDAVEANHANMDHGEDCDHCNDGDCNCEGVHDGEGCQSECTCCLSSNVFDEVRPVIAALRTGGGR